MERVDANLVPFAQNNPSGYRFAFGTDTATDDINVNYNDNIKKGWGTTPNEFPEVEDFNAMVYTIGYLLSYLYHMGIAEWNDKQKYRQYSRVIGSDGIIYKAKTGTDISPNLNNDPTSDATNWEIDNQFNINGLTDKVTPEDTDNFVIQEAGGLLKKLSWANLKATLKTYFDTLYNFYNPTPIIASGTATFTAITNNINLTGIGVGIEIGDVIQISGADDFKNNSEFTIEVITDANNVIVNQAHANKGTSKNVATRASDTGVTVKLLAKWYNAPIGLGQDWVNVTSSRVAGTTYPTQANRTISVSIINYNTNISSYILVNGLQISTFRATAAGADASGNVLVPIGGTYSITPGSVANGWGELR